MRERVVIVGAGFAGFHAARTLSRLARGVEIVLINPADYFLYLPLLPEVTAGILGPRRVAVPLTLAGVRLVLGTVDGVDVNRRRVCYMAPDGDHGGPADDQGPPRRRRVPDRAGPPGDLRLR